MEVLDSYGNGKVPESVCVIFSLFLAVAKKNDNEYDYDDTTDDDSNYTHTCMYV